MKLKKIMIYILIFALCFGLTACGNGISNSKLQKLLRENGYNYESAKVETILDLNDNVNGLDNSNKNKLVLINNNGYYGLAVINTETNKVTIPALGYTPLNVVQQEIWNMGKDINIKDVTIFKKYIERYGINSLEEKEYAEEYLRELTGKNGIIDTEKAQSIISSSTMNIFPNISSNDEVTVLFEDDSAVPVYYTTQSNIMAYNWNGIFPENVYNIWKASTDSRTQQTMMALYGQPYLPKTVWAVVDSDLNEIGTYDSLEEVKTKLLSKNTNETNTPKSGTVIVYKVNSSNKKTNTLDVVKEMIALRLKNMGYDDVTINIKDSDKIEVTLPTQDNIEDFAKTLISSSDLKFIDYNENVLLTDNDIKEVKAEYDEQNNSYYLLWIFTQEGKGKFKKATYDVSKIPNPNNYIKILLDDSVVSAPVVSQEMDNDACMIGNFSQEEAKDFEHQINYIINKPKIEILETR